MLLAGGGEALVAGLGGRFAADRRGAARGAGGGADRAGRPPGGWRAAQARLGAAAADAAATAGQRRAALRSRARRRGRCRSSRSAAALRPGPRAEPPATAAGRGPPERWRTPTAARPAGPPRGSEAARRAGLVDATGLATEALAVLQPGRVDWPACSMNGRRGGLGAPAQPSGSASRARQLADRATIACMAGGVAARRPQFDCAGCSRAGFAPSVRSHTSRTRRSRPRAPNGCPAAAALRDGSARKAQAGPQPAARVRVGLRPHMHHPRGLAPCTACAGAPRWPLRLAEGPLP